MEGSGTTGCLIGYRERLRAVVSGKLAGRITTWILLVATSGRLHPICANSPTANSVEDGMGDIERSHLTRSDPDREPRRALPLLLALEPGNRLPGGRTYQGGCWRGENTQIQ